MSSLLGWCPPPSLWPSSCSQSVSGLFPDLAWLDLVWLFTGATRYLYPMCNEDVSSFLLAEPESWTLLTGVVTWLVLHGSGLKTDWPWQSGAGKVTWVAECSSEIVLSLCERICSGKLCNLFKEVVHRVLWADFRRCSHYISFYYTSHNELYYI